MMESEYGQGSSFTFTVKTVYQEGVQAFRQISRSKDDQIVNINQETLTFSWQPTDHTGEIAYVFDLQNQINIQVEPTVMFG